MDELQQILMRIAAATGYTLEQVKVKDRHKEIVLVREIYVRELCSAGYLHWQVGEILARDRSTISYALSAYERDYETDEMFRQIADRAKGNNRI